MHLKFRKIFFLLLLFSVINKPVKASDTIQAPVRIAVLVPLYLDSVFSGYEYTLNNVNIPKFFLSGLEFYNGIMMAIDSLQKQNANIEVWVYDTHKQGQNVQQLTSEMQPLNFSMIIASLSTSLEQKTISEFSAKNSIPVISATFPNDTYLNYNPFFIMVNPTWKTHIEAVYSYLNQNFKTKKIIIFTRRGGLEDKITQELLSLNADRMLTFSSVILNDNFKDVDILSHLDSAHQNIVVCGSLNESFGRSVIKTLNTNGDSYSSVLFGMPTWNGMNGTLNSFSNHLQMIITTPYNYLRSNSRLSTLSDNYRSNYYSRPSDMVFKGYELMYHFINLLIKHPQDFINNISDTSFKIANDYNFMPVRLSNTSFVPDYLENKKIYFMKIVNGQVQSVN